MTSDEELRNNYAKDYENNVDKKYKWYSFIGWYCIDEDVILNDEFWNDEEKEKIKMLLRGEKLDNWVIETRLCHDTHLDVCVIVWKK